MSEHRILVLDEVSARRAQIAVKGIVPDLFAPTVVIVRAYQRPQSPRQLGYYQDDVLRAGAVGLGVTREELHQMLLARFYAGDERLEAWIAGAEPWRPSVGETSEYLTWAEAFLANLGVRVRTDRARAELRDLARTRRG